MQNKFSLILKQPWAKIVLLAGMLIAADRLCGWVLGYFYDRTKSGPEYATRYAAEETKADVIIIGASRAMQQYNPLILQDSLGVSAYNAGRDGMPFYYYYGIFKCITARHTPKTIILDCEYGSLTYSSSGYERIAALLPLHKRHPEINHIVALRHPWETYKMLSATYPYNSMLFKIALGNLPAKDDEAIKFNGYQPLYGKLTRTAPFINHKKYSNLDTMRLQLLQDIVTTCQQKNIQLIFVCPPYYMQSEEANPCIDYIKKIASNNNLPFLDYAKDTFFLKRPYLWEDTVHVNFEGSKIFSARLASDLKKITPTK
jgi:hypothetical protein